MQAFIKTAATIYKKIQDGVFDVSNEVNFCSFVLPHPLLFFSNSGISLDCLDELIFILKQI